VPEQPGWVQASGAPDPEAGDPDAEDPEVGDAFGEAGGMPHMTQ
jgi:hypothetical protein